MTKNLFFKRIFAFVAVIVLLFACALPACANQSDVREVAEGVFVITFNWGGKVYGRGTCFLINEDTIITANHCVNQSSAYYDAFCNTYGCTRDDIIANLSYTVILSGDGGVPATLLYASESSDYAILKLSTPIKNHKYVTLRDSSDVESAEDIYAVGFPVNKDTNYTFDKDDVAIERGTVNKSEYFDSFGMVSYADDPFPYQLNGTFLLYSGGTSSSGNSGGPVVDADGNVIGVVSCGNNSSCYAAATSKIIPVLDDLGIQYESAGISTVLVVVLSVVLGLLVIGGVVVLIVVLRSKKKKAAAAMAAPGYNSAPNGYIPPAPNEFNQTITGGFNQPTPNGFNQPTPNGFNQPTPNGFNQPTPNGFNQPAPNGFNQPAPNAPIFNPTSTPTAQLDDAGETTILSRDVNGGLLIRACNNERINISSAEFLVGRERSRTNYCVEGNLNISRVHIKLIVSGNETYLIDNNAANGTFVNGAQIEPNQSVLLKSGDQIMLADEMFIFQK